LKQTKKYFDFVSIEMDFECTVDQTKVDDFGISNDCLSKTDLLATRSTTFALELLLLLISIAYQTKFRSSTFALFRRSKWNDVHSSTVLIFQIFLAGEFH
jgi:hypothetical protein